MRNLIITRGMNIDYNLDYIVVLPKKREEFLKSFAYTFGNVILFSNTVEGLEFLTGFIRKNVIKKIIFVDFYMEYNEIINTLVEEHEIKFIFTGGLGELSDSEILYDYNAICDKYDNGLISEIGFLDPYLYKIVRKNRHNVKLIKLDIKKVEYKEEKNNNVGLLNNDTSNYDSFYNELCSLTFLNEYNGKVLNPSKTTMDFLKEYRIKVKTVSSCDELISNNVCNLDVNFANSNIIRFLESMDRGTPCVVGNNYFLEGCPQLKKYLEMESDDDVNEMAKRVRMAIVHKKEIMKDYQKFRKKYSQDVNKLAEEFLDEKIIDGGECKFDKLLSVIVPVYNTEKYLARCLDSVIESIVPGSEILIINDGSTDGSEKIALEYAKKYPDLIKYIKQKNNGLGSVRNVGLSEAKGKYLASVDSDDTIAPEFFKEALPYMKKNVDIIIYDWMSIGGSESFETPALDGIFHKRKAVEGLLYTTIMPSTCNKIIKSELFCNNRIHYLEQKYEDLSANPLVLIKAETIKYINKPYYNYYLSDNSLMRSEIDPRQMVDALKYLDSGLNKTEIAVNSDEFKFYTYSWRIEEYIINPLYNLKGRGLYDAIRYIYNIYGLVVDVFDNDYYVKMLKQLKSNELREFIMERNESFKARRLEEFIVTKKGYKKLTAGIIYYGD